MNYRSLPAVAAMLAIIAFPAAGFAQTAPDAVPSTTAPAPSNKRVPPRVTSADIEQHIQRLYAQLKITPAEETQWAAFANVMRNNAAEMGQAFTDRGAKLGTMTAIENMQSFMQLAALNATNMQNLTSAFQVLYSSFPDQQKAVADNVFRRTDAIRVHAKK